jgi:hypothetical protein
MSLGLLPDSINVPGERLIYYFQQELATIDGLKLDGNCVPDLVPGNSWMGLMEMLAFCRSFV